MQEYKPGGKLILDENEEYRIIDIVQEEDKEYLFCCTTQKPITPIIFEKIAKGEEVYVLEEDDDEIKKKIANQIIEKYGKLL